MNRNRLCEYILYTHINLGERHKTVRCYYSIHTTFCSSFLYVEYSLVVLSEQNFQKLFVVKSCNYRLRQISKQFSLRFEPELDAGLNVDLTCLEIEHWMRYVLL